jgi:hypothetical protein
VRLIALHRLYQRTCKECGYRWTLTRAQVQLRNSAGTFSRLNKLPTYASSSDATGALRAQEEARARLIDRYRTCARCGTDVFSERPITKRHPADPRA